MAHALHEGAATTQTGETIMNRILVLLALIAAPFTAHAGGFKGIIGIESPYKQLKAMAQKQGLMQKGSGERLILKTVQKPAGLGQEGTIEARITGRGGMTGMQKGSVVAVGTFKMVQEVDGQIVKDAPFAMRYYLAGGGK
jgi:hypothetical protein